MGHGTSALPTAQAPLLRVLHARNPCAAALLGRVARIENRNTHMMLVREIILASHDSSAALREFPSDEAELE
jgi:hypothetical protein